VGRASKARTTESRLPAAWFGIIGLAAIAAYYAIHGTAQTWFYDGFGAACAVALGVRARRQRRGTRAPWILATIGVVLWTAGDALSSVFSYSGTGLGALLSWADALYLLGYPALIAAIIQARRLRSPGRDRGLALEATMLVLAVALPMYEFWVRAALADAQADTLAIVVSLAYPVLDLVLLAAGIRLALGARGLTPSGLLLAVGLATNVVADAIYNVQIIRGGYSQPDPIDAGWLLSYIVWGSAALLPSASRLTAHHTAPGTTRDRRSILLALLVGSPLAVVAAAYRGAQPLDAVAVLGTLLLTTIVVAIRLREIAASDRERWRPSVFLYGSGMVVVALAMILTHAQSVSQRRADSTLALTRAQADLAGVARRSSDLRSARYDVAGTRRAAQAGLAGVARALARRDPGMLTDSGGGALDDQLATYASQVDRTLNLLADDQLVQAEGVTATRVLPAYEQLGATLDTTVSRYRSSAEATAKAERTWTIGLLLAGAFILVWMLRRFGSTRRSAERAAERARAVRDSERRLGALVAGSADILTVIDADTRVIAHPETVERVLGHPAGSMVGQRLDAFLGADDVDRTAQLLQRLRATRGASDTTDWCLRRADGSEITAEARFSNHLDDPLLGGFVLNVRDVTARRDLERELEFRAFHDHLTGLANRALLEERLRHALTRSARTLGIHAVVMIDLDDFKAVNDSFGHAAGDALLIEVGRRLRSTVRGNDTVARLGGDEFAILLEDVSTVDEALATARRLLEALRAPHTIVGRTVLVGGSAGVAVTDGHATDEAQDAADRELRNADLAMYEAKRVGDGSVELFAPEMHAAVASRVEMRSAIKKGLERGEFVVHYQPIVEFSERQIVGFEALVRWDRPGLGLVAPDVFIPIAEQTGLIVDIGTFVLGQATRQLAEWNARDGRSRYMSVNVAGAQIQRDELLLEVATAVRASGIDPEQLLLEVTETALIQDSEGNERRLDALRELGVRLGIDDFGTGYSSLSYLQRFSMDVLKIDKSFVDDIVDGGRAPLVEAMITMARALDLKVIAEGIETPGQMHALEQLGCRLGQGYLFSRPLPAAGITAELAVA
jgi:diguanylate cyclase (GGDEF)-like protein/PAS domain S-box-containing protein